MAAATAAAASPNGIATTVTDPHSPKKIVRTPEEIEALAERLYTRDVRKIQTARKEFDAAVDFKLHHNDVKKVGSAPLSTKEEQAVAHLYTQAKQRKEQGQEKLSQKFAGPSPAHKSVMPEELDQISDRLCHQAMKHKQHIVEEATKKWYGPPSEPRVLDKEAMAANVKSIYTDAVEKKQKADHKLADKYLFHRHEPKKLSTDEIKSVANRLCTTKK